jgi:hypothetical protein
MPECSHDDFESFVTVHHVLPPGATPYHQARLQVRCAACQAPLTFGALPAYTAQIFHTVSVGAGGSEVYLSGLVTPLTPAQEGQSWMQTRVVKPEPPASPPPP